MKLHDMKRCHYNGQFKAYNDTTIHGVSLDGSKYMTKCPLCGAFMHPTDIVTKRISIRTQQDLCIKIAPIPSY